MNRSKMMPAAWILPVFLLAAAPPAARGEEVLVQNDDFVSPGPTIVVGDFIQGEMAGARLTAPCDGTIVEVQIGWFWDQVHHPNPGATVEEAIYIFDAPTFPEPLGEPLEELIGPLLEPGFINQFRWLDEQQTIPLSVPVTEGQQFLVALEFYNPTDVQNGTASVFSDITQCQYGKNVLYGWIFTWGWWNFCDLPIGGLTGDLVIRAVIDCDSGPTEGVCCFEGLCYDTVPQLECESVGGVFFVGETCDTVDCVNGACCIEATQGCIDFSEADCALVGGLWMGLGTDCATFVCFPTGACCLPDGTCVDDLSPSECAAEGGTYMGDDTTCATVQCPEAVGACCLAAGCLVLTEDDCAIVAGYWAGPGTDCEDLDENGIADDCETCPEDVNGDGTVDVLDLLAVIAAWGSTGVPEDINGDGTVNVLDLLAVIAAWGDC